MDAPVVPGRHEPAAAAVVLPLRGSRASSRKRTGQRRDPPHRRHERAVVLQRRDALARAAVPQPHGPVRARSRERRPAVERRGPREERHGPGVPPQLPRLAHAPPPARVAPDLPEDRDAVGASRREPRAAGAKREVPDLVAVVEEDLGGHAGEAVAARRVGEGRGGRGGGRERGEEGVRGASAGEELRRRRASVVSVADPVCCCRSVAAPDAPATVPEPPGGHGRDRRAVVGQQRERRPRRQVVRARRRALRREGLLEERQQPVAREQAARDS